MITRDFDVKMQEDAQKGSAVKLDKTKNKEKQELSGFPFQQSCYFTDLQPSECELYVLFVGSLSQDNLPVGILILGPTQVLYISKSRMQSVRRLEALVFARMIEFQRGDMRSQLTFMVSQVAKLIFKDAFIILFFIFPLSTLTDMVEQLFTLTRGLNLMLTVSFGIFFVVFLVLVTSQCSFLSMKLKKVVQVLAPWLDVFAMMIVTVSMQLLLINMRENLTLVPLNILSIISILLVQIFYNLFNFSKEPRSNNLLQVREAQIVTLCNIAGLAITLYLSFGFFANGPFQRSQVIVISLVQFIVSLIKIKQRIFLQYYLSPFSQEVSSLFYFIELYLSMLVSADYLFGIQLLSTNLIFILIIMTLLSYSALNSYLARRNSAITLSSASELKEEDQAIIYLDRLCQLINKVEREEEDAVLVSLKKKHSLTCKSAQCYCQRTDFSLCDFVRQYVRCQILQITQIFHNSPSILISTLYFKMVIYKYYPQILAKLNYYSTHFNLSLTQRYYKYCLIQYVTKWIGRRNHEIHAVDSQRMFKLQELRTELENIITGQIQVRSKQWKYLSRGLCRISELQHTCNTSLNYISRIMQIYQQNKAVFKKSKEFNLLFLFYFVKVSFLNNGKEIKQSLKELYYGYREDQLFNLKQFQKFIYHKRSCVIETIIDTKIMGIVTAASRNVEDMFGFPISKIVGNSINNLMPQFMAIQHQDILSDWAKSGTWRTIGKLKEIYCIHKEQYCFSALLYLKIYIKDNTMHFITNIFKLNQNDYLVINPNMKIQGLGRKFLKLLGEPAKKISLELLIQNSDAILEHEKYAEGKTYRKIFLSLRNLEREVDLYLENINMKFDEKERSEANNAFHEKIKHFCLEKYYVEFTIKRYRMGKLGFVVIGLKEAKKIDKQHSIKFLQRHATILQTKSNDLIDFDALSSDQGQYQKDDDNQELLIQHNANSSLTSISDKENYPLSKTIEKFLRFVQDPSRIKDTRLGWFNLFMVTILILLTFLNLASYFFSLQLLKEIQQVFYAGGAQSDVMQSTEISYNFIYSLKSQLTSNVSLAQFDSTLTSARLINHYVYSLRLNDFSKMVAAQTPLTHQRLYSYLSKPLNWTLNSRPAQVIAHQFLQNMYYLTSRIVNNLQQKKQLNVTTINTTYFSQLFNNFPQMAQANQCFLQEYQRTSDHQHNVLNLFTISSMTLYFLLSLALALVLNHYLRFRFDQTIQSFHFFSFIPGQFLDKMRDYYAQLLVVVNQRNHLKAIDMNEDAVFNIDTFDLFRKDNSSKSNLSSKIKFINYEKYLKWAIILLLFCIVNLINYLAASQIRNFFTTSRSVIEMTTELMRSQNRLLETYFTLRSAYSLNSTISPKAYNDLIETLNQTSVSFNSLASQITTMFSQYDDDFQAKYIRQLVNNVCQLSAPFLTAFENSKCVSELSLNIMDGGMLISMNFFQRNVLTALEDLKQQLVYGNASTSSDYFQQTNFVDLDKMLIYMFKVFQQCQNITYDTYCTAIDKISNNYVRITGVMVVVFAVFLGVWLQSIPSQKKSLSYLYGHLLLIPFMILKSNTRIAGSLKEAIEYSDK